MLAVSTTGFADFSGIKVPEKEQESRWTFGLSNCKDVAAKTNMGKK